MCKICSSSFFQFNLEHIVCHRVSIFVTYDEIQTMAVLLAIYLHHSDY